MTNLVALSLMIWELIYPFCRQPMTLCLLSFLCFVLLPLLFGGIIPAVSMQIIPHIFPSFRLSIVCCQNSSVKPHNLLLLWKESCPHVTHYCFCLSPLIAPYISAGLFHHQDGGHVKDFSDSFCHISSGQSACVCLGNHLTCESLLQHHLSPKMYA